MDNHGKIAFIAFSGSLNWNSLRFSTQRNWQAGAMAVLERTAGVVPGQALHDGILECTGLPLGHLPTWKDCGSHLRSKYEHAAATLLATYPEDAENVATALPVEILDVDERRDAFLAN